MPIHSLQETESWKLHICKWNICFESSIGCRYMYIHVIHVKETIWGYMNTHAVMPWISYTYIRRFPCSIRTEESLYVRLGGNFFIFVLLLLAIFSIALHGLKTDMYISPCLKIATQKNDWVQVCIILHALALYRGTELFIHLRLTVTGNIQYRTSRNWHVSNLTLSENRYAKKRLGTSLYYLTCACSLQRNRTKCSSWDPPGFVRPTHDHPHTTLLARWNGADCSHPGTDREHPNGWRIPEPVRRNWYKNYLKVRFPVEE